MATEEPAAEPTHVRLRRSKSLNQATDFRMIEETVRRSQPDKPCHKYQDSLFSWSSGFNEFSGFVNWAFILLLMGGIRLSLENLLRYGVRVDPREWILFMLGGNGEECNETLLLLSYSIVPIFLCLFIEKGLVLKIVSENVGFILQLVNNTFIIVLPIVAITTYADEFGLFGSTLICFLYCIIFLKLWSYIQVNTWCRKDWIERTHRKLKQSKSVANRLNDSQQEKDQNTDEIEMDLVTYPNNLNAKDIFYFMVIPTLCYELNFPRTDRIRKRFLVKRLLELIIGFHVSLSIMQQWIIPSVKHSLIPFSKMDVLKTTERLLKLSIPNHLMWLISFYLLFHSFLNFIGELFHFADRNFYLDWWNAPNSDIFWRKWNTSVHRWALRHVYIPMVDIGYNKFAARSMVFFVSAFFHEFLVSVPLRTFRSWAFVSMMMQIPLASLSTSVEKKYGPRWGNIIVWLSLILGQPLCIMMYYHDYVILHFGEALLEKYGNL